MRRLSWVLAASVALLTACSGGHGHDAATGASATTSGSASGSAAASTGADAGTSAPGGGGTGGGSNPNQVVASDQKVSRTSFQADHRTWPLKVSDGTLSCDEAQVLFKTGNGDVYAVNGPAKASGEWLDIKSILAKGATQKDVDDLAKAGQALCQ